MTPLATYTKAPGAILDFPIDWSDLIGSETISTSTWTPDTGITVASSSGVGTKVATAFLSGGTIAATYKVVNRITTATRTLERTILVTIAHRTVRFAGVPFPKDPSDIREFVLDWSTWLGQISDTISSSNWTVLTTGINKDSQTNDTLTATVVLSLGTADNVYVLLNHITTAGGRQDERLVEVQVTDL